MEKELFLSGYCRATDSSRMIAVLIEDGVLEEADCRFPDCTHAPNCEIARKIKEALSDA